MLKPTGRSDRECIHHPKTKDLPPAFVDVEAVLFSCYERNVEVDAAQRECADRGVSLTIDDVEKAYEKLSQNAKWWNDFFAPYLRSKEEEQRTRSVC